METVKLVGRWIVFLPAAALSVVVLPAVVHYVAEFVLPFNFDTALGRIVIEVLKGAVIGAAFVWIGAAIAPSRQKAIALGLAAIGLMLAGAGLLSNLFTASYLHAWQAVASALGTCAVAHCVIRGELFPAPVNASSRSLATPDWNAAENTERAVDG